MAFTYLSSFSDADVLGVLWFFSWGQVEDVLDGGVWVLGGDEDFLFLVLVQRFDLEGNLIVL